MKCMYIYRYILEILKLRDWEQFLNKCIKGQLLVVHAQSFYFAKVQAYERFKSWSWALAQLLLLQIIQNHERASEIC